MWNTCDVEEGASVAVFGLGAVGLSVIQVRPRGSAPGAVGLSCLTLIIVRFSRDHRELRFKNTIIPLPYAGPWLRVQAGVCLTGPQLDTFAPVGGPPIPWWAWLAQIAPDDPAPPPPQPRPTAEHRHRLGVCGNG